MHKATAEYFTVRGRARLYARVGALFGGLGSPPAMGFFTSPDNPTPPRISIHNAGRNNWLKKEESERSLWNASSTAVPASAFRRRKNSI